MSWPELHRAREREQEEGAVIPAFQCLGGGCRQIKNSGYSLLHNELKASLQYVRPCLKKWEGHK